LLSGVDTAAWQLQALLQGLRLHKKLRGDENCEVGLCQQVLDAVQGEDHSLSPRWLCEGQQRTAQPSGADDGESHDELQRGCDELYQHLEDLPEKQNEILVKFNKNENPKQLVAISIRILLFLSRSALTIHFESSRETKRRVHDEPERKSPDNDRRLSLHETQRFRQSNLLELPA
jgi:hypothetical protein